MTNTKPRRVAPRLAAVGALAAAMAVGLALPANAIVLPADTVFYDDFQDYTEGPATGTLGPWNIEGGDTIYAGLEYVFDGGSTDGNIFLSGAQNSTQGPGNVGPVAINRDFATTAGTQYQFGISAFAGALQTDPVSPTDATTDSEFQIFIDGVLIETFLGGSTGVEYGVFTATGPSSNIRIVSTGVGLNGAAGILNGVTVYDTTDCLAGDPLPVSIVDSTVAMVGFGVLTLGAIVAVLVIRRTRENSGGGASATMTALSIVAVLGVAGLATTTVAPALAAPSISDNCQVSFIINP